MRVLTFDTSLDKTYVTLSLDGQIIANEIVENHNEKYHSAFLIPVIVDILKKNDLKMQDIDVIATNIGPGSFTGIRACVTVARVFAQQLEIPLVGVSSLEILSKINEENTKTIVVLDARKNQYYTAIYENNTQISEPKLANVDDVLNMNFDGAFVVSDASSNKFLLENNIHSVVYNECNKDLGIYLNKIANIKLTGSVRDEYFWAKLKPLYLQAPPVSMPAKSKI